MRKQKRERSKLKGAKKEKPVKVSPEIKRNILAILQAAEFVRQVRLNAKPAP
ncbi:MAG: hypothetical protein HYU99_10770 [Deltaproteobacteria bacterium]|nr:hypothetical protein [Deltaproteobacteria bacterium]